MTSLNTTMPKVAKTASWIETRIHNALRRGSDLEAKHRAGRLGLSQIGKCERALHAQMRGVVTPREVEGRILVLFDLGNYIEGQMLESLEMADFAIRQSEDGEQIRVAAFDDKAVGHLDGEIRFRRNDRADEWAVLEIKSAGRKAYDALVDAGSYSEWKPEYAAQVQVYMGLRGRTEALVVVECKDTSRLWCEISIFDPDEFERLMAKAERIVTEPEILDRPSEAKSQYCKYCKWCDANAWCWGPLAGVSFDA